MQGPADHPNQLIAFFHKGHKRVYKKGEIILYAGDEPQGVYLIENGLVKIYALSRQGTEHIHLFYSDGDVFPLIWIYTTAVRNVHYEAMKETTVWLVPKKDFKKFVATDPEVADRLLDKVTGLFRLYAGRIDNLLYSNSYERTAYCLLSLIYRFGKSIDGKIVVDEPLTHQHIASSINLSRETTSRAMERLQKKKIINYDKQRHIVITDLEKLINIIGQEEIAGMWPDLTGRL